MHEAKQDCRNNKIIDNLMGTGELRQLNYFARQIENISYKENQVKEMINYSFSVWDGATYKSIAFIYLNAVEVGIHFVKNGSSFVII